MKQKPFKQLEKQIGITFRRDKFLLAAVVHPSCQDEAHTRSSLRFQRLEFLGDAVLNYYIARKLYDIFPEGDEGLMSRLRSTLVSRKLLARIAESIRLFSYLRLNHNQQTPVLPIARQKILADAFEALIAAIYLDRGIKTVEQFLEKYFVKHLDQKKLIRFDPNPKSTLQEYIQKKLHVLPSYQTGPRKKDIFTAWVSIQGKKKTKGEGRTVREAEADAAAKLLKKFNSKKPTR